MEDESRNNHGYPPTFSDQQVMPANPHSNKIVKYQKPKPDKQRSPRERTPSPASIRKAYKQLQLENIQKGLQIDTLKQNIGYKDQEIRELKEMLGIPPSAD